MQQRIREQLLNRKDQLLRAAYYEVVRNEAKVVNFYAMKVTQNNGKKWHRDRIRSAASPCSCFSLWR